MRKLNYSDSQLVMLIERKGVKKNKHILTTRINMLNNDTIFKNVKKLFFQTNQAAETPASTKIGQGTKRTK